MSLSTQIILVRHGKPLIDPERSPGDWPLDVDTAGDVLRLAGLIAPLGVDAVVTSTEQKAVDTGDIIAGKLGVPTLVNERFAEQGGDTVSWFAEPGDFRAAVERHFRLANQPVFGEESSAEAAKRFAGAVETARACARLPVVVTHGRVMSAFVQRMTGTDASTFWGDLRMPDAFLLDLERRDWRRIGEEREA